MENDPLYLWELQVNGALFMYFPAPKEKEKARKWALELARYGHIFENKKWSEKDITVKRAKDE